VNIFFRKVRVALTPRAWKLGTPLANGAIVSGRNRRGYGGRGVYIFRDALEPELEHLEEFLVPGGVLMDIGGNTGIYTVKAAQYFRNHGGGKVVTYEPLPEMLVDLQQNLQLNQFDNVRLRSFCLGDKSGTAELWLNFRRPAASSLVRRDERAVSFSTLVFPLDVVWPLEKLDRLDYVKIDVESAEAQVLAGGDETFKKFRPIIQLETALLDPKLDLPRYSVWQSRGSPNKVCIPNENGKNENARKLNWQRVA
jgi:FkbM family methyltransferase